jgi:hypothetical protein
MEPVTVPAKVPSQSASAGACASALQSGFVRQLEKTARQMGIEVLL